MRQHPDPDPDPDGYQDEEEDLEELGTLVYEGSGLSVRALTAEELQQLFGVHQGRPARLLGSGWAALDPADHRLGDPRTPPGDERGPAGPQPAVPNQQGRRSLGSPGRSTLA